MCKIPNFYCRFNLFDLTLQYKAKFLYGTTEA